ncbi:hypothetical protein ACSBR1_002369 [Camellia fascicularis]
MFRGNHYILGWSFNKNGQAQSLDTLKLPSLPSKRKPRQIPSLEITVSLIMVSIVLIVIISVIIYFVWSEKYEEIHEDWEQEYDTQRFFYKDLYKATKGKVAVKKISHDSKQGAKEFVAEIASMGSRSLDKFLFGNEKPILNWAQRCQILRGVASSLQYLHEECEQVVLHRNVKASNVLLDADINGRLGDFVFARLYDHGANPETTHVVCTVGYLAPELT